MPRDKSRAAKLPARAEIGESVRESVAAVRNLPGVMPYSPPATPPVQTTRPIVDEDGNIGTAHVAFYDLDRYDDPGAFYYKEGQDAFAI